MPSVTLRERIEAAGGLVSKAGIARRLEVSNVRAAQLVRHPTFPVPACEIDGKPVWPWNEVAAWRRDREDMRAETR